jgi:hypothetical protein
MLRTSSCPTCTLEFVEESVERRPDIERRVATESRQCQCGQRLLFKDLDAHSDSCRVAQAELSSAVRSALIQPKVEVANRSTFKCPFCPSKNFVRETLISHIEANHGKRRGVCPICVVMPWGDPKIKSSNLLGHMQVRHKYDVDTYTDFQMNDDEILRKVLEESKSLR